MTDKETLLSLKAYTIKPEIIDIVIKNNEAFEKIKGLLEGTIDHFDRDDAMDLLYQIKEVI